MALVVTEYHQETDVRPSAWVLTTADGRKWYVRYRWGQLTIQRYDFNDNLVQAPVFSVMLGSPTDGIMSDAYMQCAVAAFFDFREARYSTRCEDAV